MFQPVVQVQLALVDDFASPTERGTGGFGSTGKA
jgi:dUTP pyrophosphatase